MGFALVGAGFLLGLLVADCLTEPPAGSQLRLAKPRLAPPVRTGLVVATRAGCRRPAVRR